MGWVCILKCGDYRWHLLGDTSGRLGVGRGSEATLDVFGMDRLWDHFKSEIFSRLPRKKSGHDLSHWICVNIICQLAWVVYKMSIVVVGLNHRSAPLEVREKVVFEKTAIRPSYEHLFSFPGIKEGLILSTCNRVEVSAVTEDIHKTKLDLVEFISSASGLKLSPYTYSYEDHHAVRHAFRVASSLDSMVIGESQILGQVKEAFRLSHEAKALGPLLHHMYEKAFRAAKRVRTETLLGREPISVGSVAVQLCQKIFHQLGPKKVLLIGAGEMMESIAGLLNKKGVKSFFWANRTFKENAYFSHDYISLDKISTVLFEIDVILVAIAGSSYILTRKMMEEAMRVRKQKPMFCIDISVPRRIDPSVHSIDNIYLYNIDDLQNIVKENAHHRMDEANRAEAIVEEEALKFFTKVQSL